MNIDVHVFFFFFFLILFIWLNWVLVVVCEI